MADHVKTFAKAKLMGLAGGGGTPIDLDGDTLHTLLTTQLSATDADSDDTEFVSGISPLAEQANASGGANYARQTLAGKTLTIVGTETYLDATDFSIANYTADGGGNANKVGGALMFKFVTNDAASVPLFWFDFADVPVVGVTFEIRWANSPTAGLAKIA